MSACSGTCTTCGLAAMGSWDEHGAITDPTLGSRRRGTGCARPRRWRTQARHVTIRSQRARGASRSSATARSSSAVQHSLGDLSWSPPCALLSWHHESAPRRRPQVNGNALYELYVRMAVNMSTPYRGNSCETKLLRWRAPTGPEPVLRRHCGSHRTGTDPANSPCPPASRPLHRLCAPRVTPALPAQRLRCRRGVMWCRRAPSEGACTGSPRRQ